MSLPSMDAAGTDGWAFSWLPFDMAMPEAQLGVQLRWHGLMLDIAVDGLAGLDARLDAPALHSLPEHLQNLVLSHFAEQVLQATQGTPLARLGGLALQSLHWHETPVAMAEGWPFVLRAPGVMGCSVGRVRVLNAHGLPDATLPERWVAGLAAAGAPLPEDLAPVTGRLQIARLALAREELAALDVGDWVWLPDVVIKPRGLRAVFRPEVGGGACEVWLQRERMLRGEPGMAEPRSALPSRAEAAAGLLPLSVVSPPLAVPRAWWHGAQPGVALPGAVMGERWVAMAGAVPWFEGALQLHGRRLALQVTGVLHHAAATPITTRTTTPTTTTTTTGA